MESMTKMRLNPRVDLFFTFGGGAIAWKSSKQTYVARSTMEAKFIALDLVGSEAKWLRNLLADIPL